MIFTHFDLTDFSIFNHKKKKRGKLIMMQVISADV